MPNSNAPTPVMRGGAQVKFEPLQNKAAIAFFKRKLPAITDHWDDWIAPVHSHSFTIAGGMSIDFLTDMQGALAKALETGTGYKEFLADFDTIVAKYGWSYKGSRGWRSRVIFNTNMRTAHMAARWEMFQQNRDVAPYLEYQARNDSRTRPEHRAWNGTILPIDHEFWSSHYPPNGWNCRCDVVAHSDYTLKLRGKSVTPAPVINRADRPVNGKTYYNVPEGLDVGWDNNVGQAWLAPEIALGKKLASLPQSIAAKAYQNQMSAAYLESISKSWSVNFDAISQKKNHELFFGYIREDVHHALIDKTDEIIEKSIQFNNLQNERNKIKIPTIESLTIQNLAVLIPDNRKNHLLGIHRNKEKIKRGEPLTEWDRRRDWEREWIAQAPMLFHQSDFVFYDIQEQTLGFLTDQAKDVNDVLRKGVIYIRINQKERYPSLANWVVSFEAKPLKDIMSQIVVLIKR